MSADVLKIKNSGYAEDGKLPIVVIDKRSMQIPPNVKHLRYSRRLPLKCDDCPFRAKEVKGNGVCSVYEKGSLCVIRKDIRTAIEKYSTRSPDQIIPLLQEEFDANYEKLKFFEALENMSAELDPEVTKRQNSLANIGKLLYELRQKKSTIELSERKTLTDDKKQEIAKVVRITREESRE